MESCLSLPLTTALAIFFLFTLIFALSPLTECPEQARQFQDIVSGLSLRFQVAGYLSLVAGEVASSHGAPSPPPPTLPQEVFEVQLLPFSKRHYRPQKAIFIKSTVIISGFMMITSLLKKTTTF